MTAAATYVGHAAPERIARRKGLAHDKAGTAVTFLSSGNLRRQRQELLIDQPLLIEITEQNRAAFD